MPPPTYKHVPGYNFRRRRVNEPLAEWLVEGFYKAIMASLTNIYFLANIVFLGYSIGASKRQNNYSARGLIVVYYCV